MVVTEFLFMDIYIVVIVYFIQKCNKHPCKYIFYTCVNISVVPVVKISKNKTAESKDMHTP